MIKLADITFGKVLEFYLVLKGRFNKIVTYKVCLGVVQIIGTLTCNILNGKVIFVFFQVTPQGVRLLEGGKCLNKAFQ